MAKHHKPPSQTWRSFLENHVKQLVSVEGGSVEARQITGGAGVRNRLNFPKRVCLGSVGQHVIVEDRQSLRARVPHPAICG
jgi:hypothetical protein